MISLCCISDSELLDFVFSSCIRVPKELKIAMSVRQHVVPCSAQGDLLRRAIMSHELHAVFGATRSRLFPPGTVSEGVADGKGGNRACLEEGVQMKEPGELGRVWSGEELMQAMRQIVVRRASMQVSVGGSQIGSEDLSRLLVFLLHCTEDALPKCSSSRQVCLSRC